jgi:hypothetical protein
LCGSKKAKFSNIYFSSFVEIGLIRAIKSGTTGTFPRERCWGGERALLGELEIHPDDVWERT